AVGDRQPGDRYDPGGRDGEDTKGKAVRVHREQVGARAGDRDVGGQLGQRAVRFDGAGDLEVDGVRSGVAVGVIDAVAQVAAQALAQTGVRQPGHGARG